MFVIAGMGRSGTTWLARVLNTDENADVRHEANPRDRTALTSAYICRHAPHTFAERCLQYIRDYRYPWMLGQSEKLYGESNGFLRWHLAALRQCGVDVRWLSRDGRDCIRSILARNTWCKRLVNRPELDDFGAACVFWAEANEHGASVTEPQERLRLDHLVSDYGHIRSRVLDPLKLNVPEERWKKWRAWRVNSHCDWNVPTAVPHWRKWSRAQRKAFDRHCSAAMGVLGYGRPKEYWNDA